MRLFVFLLLCLSVVFGHDGHLALLGEEELGRPTNWMQWIGAYHLVLIHFPIGLIVFTAIAELLFSLTKNPLYDSAARFMLISSAIVIIPTAILGLVYSQTGEYSGVMGTLLTFHAIFGVLTLILALFAVFIREREGRNNLYLFLIAILCVSVIVTGYLGGAMVYGPYHFLPPG